MSEQHHREDLPSRPIGAWRAALSIALGCFLGLGCFGVGWTGETIWTPDSTAETSLPSTAPRTTPLQLQVEYRVSGNSSIAAADGPGRLRRDLERAISPPYFVLPEGSPDEAAGLLTMRCGDPVGGVDFSGVLALLTLGILPGFDRYSMNCDAELRDGRGAVIWYLRLERTLRTAYSSLPYTYLAWGADLGGVVGYAYVRERAAETAEEFALRVARSLASEDLDVSTESRESPAE